MLVRKPLLRTLPLLSLALCLSLPSLAAEPAAGPDAARVQAVRDKLRTDRKAVVLHNLKLDAAQTSKFNVVYEAYAKEAGELARQRTRMVVEAVTQGDKLTNAQAKQASKDSLALAEAELKLLRKYHPKMVKAIGQEEANRFLEVETKILALNHYDIAWASPLSE